MLSASIKDTEKCVMAQTGTDSKDPFWASNSSGQPWWQLNLKEVACPRMSGWSDKLRACNASSKQDCYDDDNKTAK